MSKYNALIKTIIQEFRTVKNSTMYKNDVILAVAMKLFSSKVTVRVARKNTNDFIFYMPVIGHYVARMSLHQYDEIQKENHMFPLNGLHYGPDPAK